MALQRTTAPAALPVSLIEAKAHLRVDTTDDDLLITALIGSATELAEQATGRALMAQTWQLSLDTFPCAAELTRVPVQAVTSLVYADVTGTDQTLALANYTLCNSDDYSPARVVPAWSKSWPAIRSQPNAVRITYTAGYASAALVPESIKSWIKLMVGAMYENREAVNEVQTFALGFADRLLDRYKVWKL